MKKTKLTAFISAAVMAAVSLTAVSASADETLYGDANCDGKVTIADSTAILQHLGNEDKYALSPQGMENADCFNPGSGVTGMDAIAIQKIDSKLITSLPEIGEKEEISEGKEKTERVELFMGITGYPEKRVYLVGEELDLTGGEIYEGGNYFMDGHVAATFDYFYHAMTDPMYEVDASEFDSSKPGTYTIYVNHSDRLFGIDVSAQVEFTVQVVESYDDVIINE